MIFLYFHGQMQKNLTLLSNFLFCFMMIGFAAGKAKAGAPVIHKAPKPLWILSCKYYDKRPLERDIQNGAYDELVEEQINVEEQADYNHIITDVVSESGVQNNSEISVEFDPSYQRVDFHEIIIWRNNKPQGRLNIGAFKILPQENEFEKFIYDGTYSAKYILADIRKGDRIEYAYTVTGRNPILNNKFCSSVYLQGSDPIMHQFTTLLVSAARKLNSKSFNLRSLPKVSVVAGLKRYEWEDYQVPGVSTNKFQPKWLNQYARVQFSDYSKWGEVVDWALKINQVQTTFSSELAEAITKLKNRYGTNKEDYFRAAVKLVQDEIRYMGIETGPYSHKANPPDVVYKQRYGDCKDKSLLLASILNADGIEAHMALLNTDLNDKIEDYIPSANLFDHAVVVATINGKEIWADATISNQRGKGTDLYFPPYRKALILKAGNDRLSNIKETKTGKITCLEKYKIRDEVSPVKFNVITTYTLDRADETRDEIATNGITKTEKNYLDYYSRIYNKIEAADSIKIKDDEEKNELTITESYTISNFFKRDSANGKYTADFYADYINDKLPDINGQVNTPVSVNYPYDIDYTIRLTLPYGWDMDNEHDAISRNGYKFIEDKTVSGSDLDLRYQFTYLKDYIPLTELVQFKTDIKDLKDNQLPFSFYYIPDLKRVPFRLNALMLIITLILTGVFVYGGIKVYKNETREEQYQYRKYLPPALGGWLIVLMIVLVGSTLNFLKTLIEEDYYSTRKWNLILAGSVSTIHRTLLVFEVAGSVSLVCCSVFCLVLVFKKRDIAPHFLKGYYLMTVIYLFIDYFFTGFVSQDFSNYNVQEIIESVIVAALWTYYLNTSVRVKETFVVPYPD